MSTLLSFGRLSELTNYPVCRDLGVSGRSCISLRATELGFGSHVSDVLHEREWRQGVHFEGEAAMISPDVVVERHGFGIESRSVRETVILSFHGVRWCAFR